MNAKHKGAAKLWLLNLFGGAVLIAAVYFWLTLPDAHGWQVAGSGVLALLIAFFGLWLKTGSVGYFRMAEFRENGEVWRGFRHALPHLIPYAVWSAVLGACECWLWHLRMYAPQFGVYAWQQWHLHLGSPRQLYHAADWGLLILIWLLLPILWLPVASTIAGLGLRHVARSWRVLRRPVYWIWFVVLMLIGAYVPYKLVWWIPDLSTLRRQAWSAGARFAAAYVLMISAWVALLLVTGERVEREDDQRQR